MMFRYEAIDDAGALVSGDMDAESEVAVARILGARHLTPVSITEARDSGHRGRQRKASSRERLLALHELATLLESGISIAEAIEAQSVADYPLDLHEAFTSLANSIRKGDRFSGALRGAALQLPEYVYQLVEAGELTGNLGGSLRQAVEQMEYDQKLAGEFRGALMYPLILVVSGVLAVLLVFVFVVPKFASLVEKNDDLPLLAHIVLTGGIWFNEHAGWIVVALLLLATGLTVVFREEAARQKLLDILAGFPLVGIWLTETDTAKWSSVMAALLSSKVELLAALELARKGVRISSRRERLQRVISSIRGGVGLADALEAESVLTPTGYNLVRVGEKTGRLPEMMRSLARLYDESGRNRMQTVLAMIEPLSILVIGAVIGTIILGVILAITSVNDVSF